MTDRKHLRNYPPLLIAATLCLEIIAVHSLERWVLRGGKSPAALHAEQRIRAEVDVRFQQGVLMLHARQFDHALTAFHRVLQLSPRLPEAHVNMGFALLGKESYKEAMDFFTGALALRPEQVNAHYGLALAHDGLGNRQAALEEMHYYVMLTHTDDLHRPKAEETLRAWREGKDAKGGAAGKEEPRNKAASTSRTAQ